MDAVLKMGFRVIILSAIGLGALYMMHLLAQDYDRIRRPITKIVEQVLRGKREVDYLNNNEIENISINWNHILQHDPFGCLQSLICQIKSGAHVNNTEAVIFTQLVELTYNKAPAAITTAYARGLAYRSSPKGCFGEYPFCWYTAKTMLTILKWLT